MFRKQIFFNLYRNRIDKLKTLKMCTHNELILEVKSASNMYIILYRRCT